MSMQILKVADISEKDPQTNSVKYANVIYCEGQHRYIGNRQRDLICIMQKLSSRLLSVISKSRIF